MGSKSIEKVDVAIIGAGWYGLVAARTYLRLCPNVNLLVIDSDSTVGGVWSEDRLYPNLVAQVNLGLFNYTDTPMPSVGVTGERQVTGRMIHDYLQQYAEDHNLLPHIRFNTFVTQVDRTSSSGGWRLTLRDSSKIIETAKLLVAPGVTSIPNMPDIPGIEQDTSKVPVIHSMDLGKSFSELQGPEIKKVIVVGAAKSAYDAVYLLLTMGKEVTWVIRGDGAGPLAILPSTLLGIWTSIGVASTRLMTGLSPSILNTEGYLYWIFQKYPIGRWLTERFWDTVAMLSDLHAGYHKGGHVAGLRPEIENKSIFWANSGLGVVTLPDFWSTIHKGKVRVVRESLKNIDGNALVLQSNERVPTDYIVMCTGWGDHFALFDAETKQEIGLPVHPVPKNQKLDQGPDRWAQADEDADAAVNLKLPFLAHAPAVRNPGNLQRPQKKWRLYRRTVPLELAEKGDRSLVILGQIHTVQTPLVAEMQSFWAILYLLGRVTLPDSDTMVREIAEWNAWTRKRYLSQGQKFPYSLYDFLPYVDTLCKDLGINSRRKSNPVAEIFSPYRPEDFNGFIDEYFANQMNSSVSQPAVSTRLSSTLGIFGFSLAFIMILSTIAIMV
ncbi:dimethylaniline monooxygenase [Penicillium odoratum]|uniref:dimethylaniline monooxygenase n=1 Tax=Penicillium odoratum TaxID=1167516 RepID=UPI002547577C|nr:dimethylaniline monooxygenase [Penicillium odoratum]KAJ5765402.1 dimethylaniline monooxygenase [Penicillium odoratum]